MCNTILKTKEYPSFTADIQVASILCHERDLNRTLIGDLDFKSSFLPRVIRYFRIMRTLNNEAQYSWCLSHEIVLAL